MARRCRSSSRSANGAGRCRSRRHRLQGQPRRHEAHAPDPGKARGDIPSTSRLTGDRLAALARGSGLTPPSTVRGEVAPGGSRHSRGSASSGGRLCRRRETQGPGGPRERGIARGFVLYLMPYDITISSRAEGAETVDKTGAAPTGCALGRRPTYNLHQYTAAGGARLRLPLPLRLVQQGPFVAEKYRVLDDRRQPDQRLEQQPDHEPDDPGRLHQRQHRHDVRGRDPSRRGPPSMPGSRSTPLADRRPGLRITGASTTPTSPASRAPPRRAEFAADLSAETEIVALSGAAGSPLGARRRTPPSTPHFSCSTRRSTTRRASSPRVGWSTVTFMSAWPPGTTTDGSGGTVPSGCANNPSPQEATSNSCSLTSPPCVTPDTGPASNPPPIPLSDAGAGLRAPPPKLRTVSSGNESTGRASLEAVRRSKGGRPLRNFIGAAHAGGCSDAARNL